LSHAPESPDQPEPMEVPARLVPLVNEITEKLSYQEPEDALTVALGAVLSILEHQGKNGLVLLVRGSNVVLLNDTSNSNGVTATRKAYFSGQVDDIIPFELRRRSR
jgi:hypothetical protein